MPETFSEAMEIVGEIRRLRPSWLRITPQRGEYMRIFHDWKSKSGGMWRRARETPSREAGFIDQLGGAELKAARHDAQNSRKTVNEYGAKEPVPLDKIYFTGPLAIPGSKGGAVASIVASYFVFLPE
jgi:hypothetical protein